MFTRATVLSALLCGPLLPAQNAEPKPDPAILLLSSSVPKSDAVALRAAIIRAYPVAPEVTIEPDGAVLEFEDGRVLVNRLHEPVALTTKALENVDGAEVVARIRNHAGGWRLCLLGCSQEDDDRIHAHFILGRLAAELLGPDCVAVGSSDLGCFEPVGEDTAEMLRREPIQALGPIKCSRVEVLLTAVRRWRESDLRAAVAKGFGEDVPEQAVEGAPVWVWAGGRDGADARVVVHEKTMMLRMLDRPRSDLADATSDERSRGAAERHHAWMLIAAFGKGGAAAERARYQAIGRTLAGLWGDDCTAILWRTDRRLIAASPVTPVLLFSDDPVAATLAAEFPPLVDDAAAMQRAAEEARRRWTEAAAFLAGGGVVHAAFGFTTEATEQELIWARIFEIAGGNAGNEEAGADLLRLGEVLSGNRTQLLDWVFEKDGQLHGGFALKLQMAAIRAKKPAPPAGK